MEYRQSEEVNTIELPQWFETVGTVRCTDGIAKDITFKVTVDSPSTILSFVADRAKVAWRSKVATKSVKGDDDKMHEERLFTIDEIEEMGTIEVSLSEFEPKAKGPRKPATAIAVSGNIRGGAYNKAELEKLIAEGQAKLDMMGEQEEMAEIGS